MSRSDREAVPALPEMARGAAPSLGRLHRVPLPTADEGIERCRHPSHSRAVDVGRREGLAEGVADAANEARVVQRIPDALFEHADEGLAKGLVLQRRDDPRGESREDLVHKGLVAEHFGDGLLHDEERGPHLLALCGRARALRSSGEDVGHQARVPRRCGRHALRDAQQRLVDMRIRRRRLRHFPEGRHQLLLERLIRSELQHGRLGTADDALVCQATVHYIAQGAHHLLPELPISREG
mmetsp:Transcript_92743/g.259225  ORF Transcript_92743/g.259225 Transcript_92743/m.259225 type:complete len:239 (+) Transcript_92743:179-895(+)